MGYKIKLTDGLYADFQQVSNSAIEVVSTPLELAEGFETLEQAQVAANAIREGRDHYWMFLTDHTAAEIVEVQTTIVGTHPLGDTDEV